MLGLLVTIAPTAGPIYLANVNGLNSLQIGQYLAVTGVFQFASAVGAGLAARWMDSRVKLALSLGMFGIGAWMNSNMSVDWAFWEFFWLQAIRGFSMMFIFCRSTRSRWGLYRRTK